MLSLLLLLACSSEEPLDTGSDDFETDLRAAIAQRQSGSLNTWYFHVHGSQKATLRILLLQHNSPSSVVHRLV